jgi:hypothetical protein
LAVEEKLIFTEMTASMGGANFGLPDYFGANPQPIQTKGQAVKGILKNKTQKNHFSGTGKLNRFGLPARRPGTATSKKEKPKSKQTKWVAPEWNANTVPESIFFDKTNDKDYMRKQVRGSSRGGAKSPNKDLLPFQVQKDSEAGKSMKVRFKTRTGAKEVQIYHDIDKLNQDMGLNETGDRDYSIRQNEEALRDLAH